MYCLNRYFFLCVCHPNNLCSYYVWLSPYLVVRHAVRTEASRNSGSYGRCYRNRRIGTQYILSRFCPIRIFDRLAIRAFFISEKNNASSSRSPLSARHYLHSFGTQYTMAYALLRQGCFSYILKPLTQEHPLFPYGNLAVLSGIQIHIYTAANLAEKLNTPEKNVTCGSLQKNYRPSSITDTSEKTTHIYSHHFYEHNIIC